MANEWMCLFVFASWWWLCKELLYFSCFKRWLLGNRGQNFGLGTEFLVHILFIFYLFLAKFIKCFLFYRNSEVFRRWKNYAKGITSTKIVYKMISSAGNLVVFCFAECWIDCLIYYTLKRSMIEKNIQWRVYNV